MFHPRLTLSPRWSARLGLATVILFFCVPLFQGLDGWDQRNDEAIYSYAVDRILETGDWLTPRSIPSDLPFLEKPPLKFWIVAGAMRLGMIPFDDWGMRVIDALFCSLAYMYVYGLGRRLAGPVTGVASVLVLFAFEPLIFEHGIRGNNMEGALLLAYCGGMYHFARWAESAPGARRHADAMGAYFVLGFMTKFVAAVFLPIVAIGASLVRPQPWRTWRERWREWIGPVAFTALAILPWFVYQAFHSGQEFWDVIFGQHVYARFAATLIPEHVRPWHHYFTKLWTELQFSHCLEIIVLGVGALAWRAWWRREWLARFLFLWWIVPFVLISLGRSKLFYYAYPFLPPLAIGAGLAASIIADAVRTWGRAVLVRLGLRALAPEEEAIRRVRPIGLALALLGVICFLLALWTNLEGPVRWEPGGIRVFRNGSVVRPIVLGAVCWYFAGWGSVALRGFGLMLALLMPLSVYAARVDRLSSIDHPIRAARDCALRVQAADPTAVRGVFNASGDIHHGFFYYLRRLGPWLDRRDARPDELQRRLEVQGEQTVTVLAAEDYVRLGGELSPVVKSSTGGSVFSPDHAVRLAHGLPPGIAIGDLVVLLFPGPYAGCAPDAAGAGAKLLKAFARSPAPTIQTAGSVSESAGARTNR